MQMTVTDNLKTTFAKTAGPKKFTKFVQERSQIVDKSLAGILMSILTWFTYHALACAKVAAKLRSLAVNAN